MGEGRDHSSSNDGGDSPIMPTTLVFTPTAEEAKYWIRGHRTFCASSASGIVASGITVSLESYSHRLVLTFITVSLRFNQDAHAIVRAFPIVYA